MPSDPTRFVIIGNGAAGTYAAEQLRKDDAAAEIVMIDDEKYTLYNRVSLPRYLRGVLLEQRVQVRDMEWHVKNRIDLRLETRVTQVNFEERTVAIEPGSELSYDKLLIATGGRPNPLRVPGSDDAPYLFNFQYFDETKAMVARIPESKVAVVLGGSSSVTSSPRHSRSASSRPTGCNAGRGSCGARSTSRVERWSRSSPRTPGSSCITRSRSRSSSGRTDS